jgi:glucose-6-phosphate isomerase
MPAAARGRRERPPFPGLRLGAHTGAVARRLARLAADRFAARLFAADPALWGADPAVRRAIRKRLGWLHAAGRMRDEIAALERFAEGVRAAGARHVVLLGMGGSSLAPEVLRRVFGPAPGRPDLIVLDSTVPAAVARVEAAIDPLRTLFLVSSKSGTTIETAALEEYFWARLRRLRRGEAAAQFAAVTDPGTPLAERGRTRRYRAVFHNPEDIGGRYSALSYFGLVPAALLGVDLRLFLARAVRMQERCAAESPRDNPGLLLGAALGELARAGRDKVLLFLEPALAGFELWIEQLLAESTGKAGRGLVPIPAGPPGPALSGRGAGSALLRGADRVAVAIGLAGGAHDRAIRTALERGRDGAPLCALWLEDRHDLGAAMLRWEVATAVAGSVLGINPFDEPNVAEAKAATEAILTGRGRPRAAPAGGGASAVRRRRSGERGRPAPPVIVRGAAARPARAALARFLGSARRGDYVAILAYADPFDAAAARDLERARARIAAVTRVPATLGYGPRYLHSTGQLHKGGPPSPLVLMLVPDDALRLPVPGRPYDFETLKKAQALGDFAALAGRGRRVLRLEPPDGGAAARFLLRALPAGRAS